jgi:signal transduction histidine kinase
MARLEPESAGRPAAPVALDALVRSVVAELEAVAGEKQVALTFGRVEPLEATGYEDALRLLATNLVDNAIRYTPAGGRIEVRAYADGAEALLEVADDGPGIPAGERARVFDRFFRGAAGAGVSGSGLGLAIVKQVADLHRGRVELADGLDGRGLTVRVRLPLSSASS